MRGEKSTPRPCSKAKDTSSDQNLDEGKYDRRDHQVISGQLMGFRILGQKWAGRAKRATTKQIQDRKETTNARGLNKRANKRELVGTRNPFMTIHKPKTTSYKCNNSQKAKCRTDKIQTTKCRSMTCNRVSAQTKRVQSATQVVQEAKRARTHAYSIRMHMEFEIELQIASSTRSFRQISCPRSGMQRRSSS